MRELGPGVGASADARAARRAFLLETAGELTLVDTLFEGDGRQVLEAIRAIGRSPGDLKRIALRTRTARTSAASRR